ncbi:Alpha-1,2-mannosyltransferase MNN22 [Labeo rohita]|uniref:Alpha-1,2-mannosyltransferase MNN22 n=1 Tax=Labeo rohita TaxID=84645 RepID=A0ABQ8MAX4_LABRO|nr:Alpha-1,2-mannosyltransferase MNN22 [Labeo rohita]
MRHFLPKHSSSSAASSHPKPAPTQQPVKPAPSAAQSAPKPETRHQSRLARRYPFPKCQGPRPKVVLDQAPQAIPFCFRCRWQCVCDKHSCEPWVRSNSAHTTIGCYSGKNKTHSQKESTFPLPPTTNSEPTQGRQLFETIHPLALWAEAWQAIPGVSSWMIGIIRRGYTLQFTRRLPRFSGVVSTLVQGKDPDIARTKVRNLLAKGAVEMVRLLFPVPKKDGGLRPILDLRTISAALSGTVAQPPETGPPLSGEQNNMLMQYAELWARWEPANLPKSVLNTISQARVLSTRRLYTVIWSVFSGWCAARELLEKGCSPSTLKIYVPAIAAYYAPIASQSGSRRLNPPHPITVPSWDLPIVLRALRSPPFETLHSIDLRPLTLKTALLLALASVKRIGDLQALSVNPACLEFGPNDSKVVLKTKQGYVPKVLSTPFRAQVITLLVLSPSEQDQDFNLLCPVRALRTFIERLQCPMGVGAHSTRGVASSWAWSSGVSITEICAVAGWASPSTFARFYSLDVQALQAWVLSA